MFRRITILILIIFFFIGCENGLNHLSKNSERETLTKIKQDSQTSIEYNNHFTHPNNELELKKHKETLKVHFIDVGQAEATLFEWNENNQQHAILYDTGAWNRNDVINYLDLQQIETIDLIVISHPDANHIGQLPEIIEKFSVEEIWFSGNTRTSKAFEKSVESVMASNADYHEPRKGEVFQSGPIKIEVFHPDKLTGKIGEDSIVLRATYGEIKFLLTGDIRAKQELAMVNQLPSLKANILQLGNHGSNTSNVEYFLQSVQPEVAIYSTSKDNPYDYPHEEVISLLKELKVQTYGTDQHGTIMIQTDGENYEVLTKKEGTISPLNTGMPSIAY